jgi:hypothetical protein
MPATRSVVSVLVSFVGRSFSTPSSRPCGRPPAALGRQQYNGRQTAAPQRHKSNVQADPGNNAINSDGAYQIASDKVAQPNSAVFIASLRTRPLTLCYGGERIARVLKRPVATKVIALAQRPCNGLS